MSSLEVLRVGFLAVVQDQGRPGLGHLGVGPAGAADRGALASANQLVGNDAVAAGLEVLLGGLSLRAHGPVAVAVTGAPVPVTVQGRPMGGGGAFVLESGHTLELGLATSGLRSYLAVRGGLAVTPVLGSRSWDSLAHLGPEPLHPGCILPVGTPPRTWPAGPPFHLAPQLETAVTLRVIRGPRDDWIADLHALFTTTWTVSNHSDRVGIRLEGPPLTRAADFENSELPSEGTVRGAIQVPSGGTPVLFGPDHPLTGGYPVVAVVVDADLDRTGQLRPGDRVDLRAVPAPTS